ncbi:PDDEXK nuclease domain-containing protein [Amphritea sp. 1_MG-2023]|uniref:PDDEXK nuclease domain-containing protein n=1 Tax=Amphritea sp. 1_MG-2023 TaxID=3062670 RepID=UPI0026E16570|nr:PDDEXK nuclease domain-containing protein [Amphritea sp. 1_MG-2023]MDO6564633.1 PDDEXK nuclease domain-containing protein [Amphritea sp. 1_MG-2023]
MSQTPQLPDNIPPLFKQIRGLIDQARQRAAVAVNAELTLLYWHVGQAIHTQVLKEQRAEYGKQVIATLAKQLTALYGKGWGKRNLMNMVRFAELLPEQHIVQTLSAQLSWSHFIQLLALSDPLQREFYTQMAAQENWSTRVLRERIDSMLYERTALSKQPEATILDDLAQLAEKGDLTPALLLKDPYVLDFLQLNDRYLEKDLEDAILRELEQFLLELGAGFTFIARQKRIQIDGDDFYIDLLFYNRKLKRLIVIDLKLGRFKAEDKGQMELYLRWLAKYEQETDELPPLGIVLCASKKQEQIELLELDKSGIHVAEYLTVLPSKEQLEAKLHNAIENAQKRLATRK